MAIKKETVKTVKSKGKATTAIVPWDEEFAKYAKQATEQVKNIGGGVGVKFGRGTIAVGGMTVPGGRLECIIIGATPLNKWYEGKYDPNELAPPDCYAFGEILGDEEMAPHAEAASPQADKCADCEKNVFGSAETGRGKACQNTIRLGIITAKDAEDADDIAGAELTTAGVSPTNLKHYAGYVKALADDQSRPPWAVITEISSHDDPKTQIRLEFRLVETITDNDVLTALKKRAEKVHDTLVMPFQAAAAAPVAKKGAVGKSSKFAGGKAAPAKGRGR
jgi:hypothetical protein